MRRFGVRAWAVSLAAVVMAGMVPADSVAVTGNERGISLPQLKQPRAVPVQPVRAGGSKRPDAAAEHAWRQPPQVAWPSKGAAEVELSDGGVRRAGTLPLYFGELPGGRGSAALKAPGKLKVALADRERAHRAGVDGLLMTLERDVDSSRQRKLRVEVDYSALRNAYGGDWAARLRLVRMPACAWSTPQLSKCRIGTPLRTTNDPRTGRLAAQIAPTSSARVKGQAGAAAVPTVLAATAGVEGTTGNYRVTPLTASGNWSAGGSTGAFTWSYPIEVPDVPGGQKPPVALSYSSQSVDGRTAASNNQPSWVGDGWSWEPGYIERRYKVCNDDQTGGTNTSKVGDLCWYNDNATLSLNGTYTDLVWEKGKGWHPATDSGEKVEKLTGAVNGDKGVDGVDGVGEHWKITTQDGTQYFFGLNHLPGWSDHGSAEDGP
ncbi:hypothetical protein ACH4C2_36480 [Streptomyces sp. NPDC018057]|uniref:hypothetical protein n=1 Tax=unclassified Streptomyces TaxID=2593676 RepID=UPI0037B1B827